jgi:hypothetical protein
MNVAMEQRVKSIAACQTAVRGSCDNETSACGSVDTTAAVSIPSLFQNIMCEILGTVLNFANDSSSFYGPKFDHSTTMKTSQLFKRSIPETPPECAESLIS